MIRAVTDHGHVHELPSASVLRERGKRLTVQRAAIWDALAGEPDLHLSAEEVACSVQGRLPQVNASTVYRTLDVLVDEGLVTRSDLGRGRDVFEPAHAHPHHHLVCESCGSVAHVHDDLLGGLGARLAEQRGFHLGEREVAFFGTCARCRQTNAKGAA
jgi:Fur family transcriptional regulator, ferric uptake regulator